MRTSICEICGDAYLGEEKPKNCPFCGAPENFIKEGGTANPLINQKEEIGEVSEKNLREALTLEVKASAVYACMAGKAQTYEVKAMYKRLAKIELEHAVIICKLLKINQPETTAEICGDSEAENFRRTIELEEKAVNIYDKFGEESSERNIKTLFSALSQVEAEHIELMKNYI